MKGDNRQVIIGEAINYVDPTIVSNAADIVVRQDLVNLRNEIGEYAYKFLKYDVGYTYKIGSMGGSTIAGDSISIEASRHHDGIISIENQYDGSLQEYLTNGQNPNAIFLETETESKFNLGFIALEVDRYSSGDENKGFLAEVAVGAGKLTNLTFGGGERNSDLGLILQKKTILPVDEYGVSIAVDNVFNQMKIEFPDLALSEDRFVQLVTANMEYGDLTNNANAFEAAAVVVNEILFGATPANIDTINDEAEVIGFLQYAKGIHQNDGTYDGFEGYDNYSDAWEASEVEEVVEELSGDDLKKALEASFVETVSDVQTITSTLTVPVKIENPDGSIEEVNLNPAERKIAVFAERVELFKTEGVVVSQIVDTETLYDQEFNRTTTVRELYGAQQQVVEWELAGANLPDNGVTRQELILERDASGTLVPVLENTSFTDAGGRVHETIEQLDQETGNWVVRETISDANGNLLTTEPKSFIVPADDSLITNLQFIGSSAGGILADALSDDNVYKEVIYKALINTITDHFGTFAGFLAADNDLETAVEAAKGANVQGTILDTPEIAESFYNNLSSLTASKLAGLIVDEIGDAIGIEGTVVGEVFDVAGTTVTTGLIQGGFGLLFNEVDGNLYSGILNGSVNFGDFARDAQGNFIVQTDGTKLTVGEQIQGQIFNALGGYAGSRLAGEFVEAENEAAAYLGTIGAAYAGAVGAAVSVGVSLSTALTSAFSTATLAKVGAAAGSVVPVIGTAIGAFIGTIAGTAFGNVFGGDDEPTAFAHIGYDYDTTNGQFVLGQSWSMDGGDASIAASMAQEAIAGINNIISESHGKLRAGAQAPKIQIGYEGDSFQVSVNGGGMRYFGTAQEAVLHAAFKIMKNFDLVGGHAVVMRAWHNSDADNIYAMAEDIEVAEAFQNYLANPTGILALMMDDPESETAQSWAAILQRAAELELHLPHEKDLDGGWGEILLAQDIDPDVIPSIEGNDLVITDPVTGEETVIHHVIGPGYEIVRIEGTDGNDIIEVIVDGPSITYVDAGDGDDIIEGSEQDDVLYGGRGDDTINGNDGNDWLHGGQGDDTIDGGAGEDLVVGGQNNDYLIGGNDSDRIYGNGGDDFLEDGDGADYLYGGDGQDYLIATDDQEEDRLYGGEGDDILVSQGRDDKLYGGAGNDYFDTSSANSLGSTVYINRDEGHDVLSINANHTTRLDFHKSISIYELIFKNENDDLKIYIAGEDQSVTVNDYFANTDLLLSLFTNSGWFFLAHREDIRENQWEPYGFDNIGTINTLINIDSDVAVTGQYNEVSHADTQARENIIYETALWAFDDPSNLATQLIQGNTNSDPNLRLNGQVRTVDGRSGDDTILSIATNSVNERMLGGNGNDTISGKKGHDTLSGGLGDDHLSGNSGDDKIYGSSGDDIAFGGSGNDEVSGGAHDDEIHGNEGDDILRGDQGYDIIYGGDGHDRIDGGSEADEIYGDNGDDVLRGSWGDDDIEGGAGRDTIFGDGGFDTIDGGAGDDWISGGDGWDTIDGGLGADTINGGAGDDTLIFTWMSDPGYTDATEESYDGGEGNDVLKLNLETHHLYDASLLTDLQYYEDNRELYSGGKFIYLTSLSLYISGFETIEITTPMAFDTVLDGTAGDDTAMMGTAGHDQIAALEGNDTISGYDGDDHLMGGLGDDYIDAGNGDDILEGGAGIDNLIGRSGNDAIHGGEGDDIVDGKDGDDVLFGDEGDDLLKGETGNDHLNGGAGADDLYGHGGVDELHGGDGDDRLYGGTEDDTLNADDGDDEAYGGEGNDVIDGGRGHDLIRGDQGNDQIHGGIGHDTIYGDTTFDDTWGGDDEIHAGEGDDLVYGSRGADVIYGDEGADGIFGGRDDDVIYGGEGDDASGIYVVGNVMEGGLRGEDGHDIIYGGAGRDWISGGRGDDWLYGGTGDDVIEGGEGHDHIFGGDGDDLLKGDSENDFLYGEAGRDTLRGHDDQDVLFGGADDDQLEGYAGNDHMFGGGGADTHYGYSGQDRFFFDTESFDGTIDTIKDFELSQYEKIIVLEDVLTGWDAVNSDIADFITFTESGGDTQVFVDRDGTGSIHGAQQIAVVENVTGLGYGNNFRVEADPYP